MQTKVCAISNCIHNGNPQPLTNFYKHKQNSDGYYSKCKDCAVKWQLEYAKQNPEKIKKYLLEYTTTNKEELKIQRKEYLQSFAKWETYNNSFGNAEEVQQDSNNLDLIQVRCTQCKEWMNPTNRQVVNRLSALSGTDDGRHRENHFYCSTECKDLCPVFRKITWPEGYKSKASAREVNPQFRKMILDRDNNTCQKCEIHKDDLEVALHVHHIIPFAVDPMSDCDLENGITLCKDCHIEVHKLPGCTFPELRNCKN